MVINQYWMCLEMGYASQKHSHFFISFKIIFFIGNHHDEPLMNHWDPWATPAARPQPGLLQLQWQPGDPIRPMPLERRRGETGTTRPGREKWMEACGGFWQAYKIYKYSYSNRYNTYKCSIHTLTLPTCRIL